MSTPFLLAHELPRSQRAMPSTVATARLSPLAVHNRSVHSPCAGVSDGALLPKNLCLIVAACFHASTTSCASIVVAAKQVAPAALRTLPCHAKALHLST